MAEFQHRHTFGPFGIECIVRTNGSRHPLMEKAAKADTGYGYVPASDDRVIVRVHAPSGTLTFEEGELVAGPCTDDQYQDVLRKMRTELFGPVMYKRDPVPEYILATVGRAVPLPPQEAPVKGYGGATSKR